MSEFIKFRTALQKQFHKMSKEGNTLFISEVSKGSVWDTYLSSFQEGTNPIFRERSEHDCQCCKQFVRYIGRIVADINGELVSVWDVNVGGKYQPVADALKMLNLTSNIGGIFLHNEREVGKESSIEVDESGDIVWDHFHQVIPEASYRKSGISEEKGSLQTNRKVLQRSLDEITEASVDIVLELIDQDSIYRGTEHKSTVQLIKSLQNEYESSSNGSLYLWKKAVELGGVCSLRNTVIGTLLIDISKGIELEDAVKKFEDKVAPHNYKRSKSLVTEKMKNDAKNTAKSLGIEPSLLRRHATKEDIRVENVLFADHSVKPFMEDSVFDKISTGSKSNKVQKFDKVQEVSVDKFVKDILPTVDTVELFLENNLDKHLMTLVAPVHGTAPNIMKWGNNFSWTYNGDVADSLMKEQVRSKGGNVEGALRFTHSWNHDNGNNSLMDLHLFLPTHNITEDRVGGKEVHDRYGNSNRVGWNNRMHHMTGGVQDVDHVDAAPSGFIPVENISFPDLSRMPEGTYTCKIHNWQKRNLNTSGGKAEIEFEGQIFSYDYSSCPLEHKEWLTLAEVTLKGGKFSIDHKMQNEQQVKQIWGLQTKKFHKVDMITNSPNHWDGEETGNKHLFFILNECKNPDSVRGFYNEYLRQDLDKHRKVFEVLASQLKADYSEEQLSGVGISSTLDKEVVLKVTGKTSRIIKVKF